MVEQTSDFQVYALWISLAPVMCIYCHEAIINLTKIFTFLFNLKAITRNLPYFRRLSLVLGFLSFLPQAHRPWSQILATQG